MSARMEAADVHPESGNAALILGCVSRGEPLTIFGVRYVPDPDVPEPVVTDAEARAMRKALARLDRMEGR